MAPMMQLTEKFGFLNYPAELDFGHGRIVPLADFESGRQFIETYGNRDGYLYPPFVRSYSAEIWEIRKPGSECHFRER